MESSALPPGYAGLYSAPSFPNAIQWSEENLLAVASGHLVTIHSPGDLEGPRGFVAFGADESFSSSSGVALPEGAPMAPELLEFHLLAQEVLQAPSQARGLARSLSWSPAGLAPSGGCLMAVCTNDHKVRLFAAGRLSHEWQEQADLSRLLQEHHEGTAWKAVLAHRRALKDLREAQAPPPPAPPSPPPARPPSTASGPSPPGRHSPLHPPPGWHPSSRISSPPSSPPPAPPAAEDGAPMGVGSRVEAMPNDVGLEGCWFTGEVIEVSAEKGVRVRYDELLDEGGEEEGVKLEEWVPLLSAADHAAKYVASLETHVAGRWMVAEEGGAKLVRPEHPKGAEGGLPPDLVEGQWVSAWADDGWWDSRFLGYGPAPRGKKAAPRKARVEMIAGTEVTLDPSHLRVCQVWGGDGQGGWLSAVEVLEAAAGEAPASSGRAGSSAPRRGRKAAAAEAGGRGGGAVPARGRKRKAAVVEIEEEEEGEGVDDEEGEEAPARGRKRKARRGAAVIDSSEEEEEDEAPTPRRDGGGRALPPPYQVPAGLTERDLPPLDASTSAAVTTRSMAECFLARWLQLREVVPEAERPRYVKGQHLTGPDARLVEQARAEILAVHGARLAMQGLMEKDLLREGRRAIRVEVIKTRGGGEEGEDEEDGGGGGGGGAEEVSPPATSPSGRPVRRQAAAALLKIASATAGGGADAGGGQEEGDPAVAEEELTEGEDEAVEGEVEEEEEEGDVEEDEEEEEEGVQGGRGRQRGGGGARRRRAGGALGGLPTFNNIKKRLESLEPSLVAARAAGGALAIPRVFQAGGGGGDAAAGSAEKALRLRIQACTSVAWSPRLEGGQAGPESVLAVGTRAGIVLLWGVGPPKQPGGKAHVSLLSAEQAHAGTVSALSWAPAPGGGALLATGCADGGIVLWSLRPGPAEAGLERVAEVCTTDGLAVTSVSLAAREARVLVAAGKGPGGILAWEGGVEGGEDASSSISVQPRTRAWRGQAATSMVSGVAWGAGDGELTVSAAGGGLAAWRVAGAEILSASAPVHHTPAGKGVPPARAAPPTRGVFGVASSPNGLFTACVAALGAAGSGGVSQLYDRLHRGVVYVVGPPPPPEGGDKSGAGLRQAALSVATSLASLPPPACLWDLCEIMRVPAAPPGLAAEVLMALEAPYLAAAGAAGTAGFYASMSAGAWRGLQIATVLRRGLQGKAFPPPPPPPAAAAALPEDPGGVDATLGADGADAAALVSRNDGELMERHVLWALSGGRGAGAAPAPPPPLPPPGAGRALMADWVAARPAARPALQDAAAACREAGGGVGGELPLRDTCGICGAPACVTASGSALCRPAGGGEGHELPRCVVSFSACTGGRAWSCGSCSRAVEDPAGGLGAGGAPCCPVCGVLLQAEKRPPFLLSAAQV